jgi:hypothetical protein
MRFAAHEVRQARFGPHIRRARFRDGAVCGARRERDRRGRPCSALFGPARPEKLDQLPDKANGAAKEPTCRVVLTRPLIIFLKTQDGKIIPLGVLTSLRTRC